MAVEARLVVMILTDEETGKPINIVSVEAPLEEMVLVNGLSVAGRRSVCVTTEIGLEADVEPVEPVVFDVRAELVFEVAVNASEAWPIMTVSIPPFVIERVEVKAVAALSVIVTTKPEEAAVAPLGLPTTIV